MLLGKVYSHGVTELKPSKEEIASGNVTIPLTVTYTDPAGNEKTASLSMKITDVLKSIAIPDDISKKPTSEFKHGDSFTTGTGKLTVTYESENTKEIDLNDADLDDGSGDVSTSPTIAEYAGTKQVSKTVTVTYEENGTSKTTSYPITIKDYITDIKLNKETINGEYNKPMSYLITKNTLQYALVYAGNGQGTMTDLVDTMVPSYDATKTENQTVSVSWTDTDVNSNTYNKTFTKNLTITFEDSLQSIEITAPTKTEYLYGESLQLGTGVIKLKYVNKEDTTSVKITPQMVTENGAAFNMSPDITEFPYVSGTSGPRQNTMQKTFKIEYQDPTTGIKGSTNYTVTIINDVDKIEIAPASKTILESKTYSVGDTLDLTISDGVYADVLVYRKADMANPETVKINTLQIGAFDSTAASSRTRHNSNTY